MESEQVAEAIHELGEFATTTARTIANHREQLSRHESILLAEFKAGESHRDAIIAIRKDVSGLAELVNAQSALLAAMQRTLVRIVRNLGLDPEEANPDSIN